MIREIYLTVAAEEGAESLLEEVIKPALRAAGYNIDDGEDVEEGDVLRPWVVLNSTSDPSAIALLAGDPEEALVQFTPVTDEDEV